MRSSKKWIGIILCFALLAALIPQSMTLAEDSLAVELTSPTNSSVVRIGSEILLKAKSAAAESVDFYVNNALYQTATTGNNGLFSVKYTVPNAAKLTIKAVAKSGVTTAAAASINAYPVKGTEKTYKTASTGDTNAVSAEAVGSHSAASKLAPKTDKNAGLDVYLGNSLTDDANALRGGLIMVEYDQYTNAGNNALMLNNSTTANGTGANTYPEYKTEKGVFCYTKGIDQWAYTASTYQTTANTWYHMQYVLNLDTLTKDVYINGEKIISQVPSRALDRHYFQRIRLYGLEKNATYYFDNLKIYALPAVSTDITLTTPENNTVLEIGVPVLLKAAASSASTVQFYNGSVFIGNGSDADGDGVFELLWTPLSADNTAISAKAVINAAEKESVTIEVSYTAKQDFAIDANVWNSNGTNGTYVYNVADGTHTTAIRMTPKEATKAPSIFFENKTNNKLPLGVENIVSGDKLVVSYDVKTSDTDVPIGVSTVLRGYVTESLWCTDTIMSNGYFTVVKAPNVSIPLKRNQWYTVSVVYDFTTNTKDVYFDGEQVAKNVAIANTAVQKENLAAVRFETSQLTSDKTYSTLLVDHPSVRLCKAVSGDMVINNAVLLLNNNKITKLSELANGTLTFAPSLWSNTSESMDVIIAYYSGDMLQSVDSKTVSANAASFTNALASINVDSVKTDDFVCGYVWKNSNQKPLCKKISLEH